MCCSLINTLLALANYGIGGVEHYRMCICWEIITISENNITILIDYFAIIAQLVMFYSLHNQPI